MGIVKKTEPNDKVRQKIKACRDAGMDVKQDFLKGIAEIRQDGVLVLRCVRVSPQSWQMEYNDEYWDERARTES